MPRNYVKVLGPTRRLNYDEKYLHNAITAVRQKHFSIAKASECFAIPYTTLHRCLKSIENNEVPRPMGGQTVLSLDEEKMIVEGLVKCSEWGFPMTKRDIRNVVQDYLNRLGKVTRFSDNMPGPDWMNSFITRHNEISERVAEHIKRARAGVTEETIVKYFNNLKTALEGVPKCNIVNYDETAFVDDVGSQKCVVKRGIRHAELIKDTSKTSISVMMAVAACGTMLPPYTVYKSKEMYTTWTANGVYGAAYNRNKSGWMETCIFTVWFEVIVMPYFRKKIGPKAIIGDNCSSHVSLRVIQLCQEHDIRFILLPPNTTHLTQPLDVAFFHPIKTHWRDVLDDWKKSNRGALQKDSFPALLAAVFQKLDLLRSGTDEKKLVKCTKKGDETRKGLKNAIAGFAACGIFPFKPDNVLKRLRKRSPSNSSEKSPETWVESLVAHLDDKHRSITQNTRTRKRKLYLSPGKSIVPNMIESDQEDDEYLVDDVKPVEPVKPVKRAKRGRPKLSEQNKAIPPKNKAVSEENQAVSEEKENISEKNKAISESPNLEEGDFALMKFKTNKNPRYFIGRIVFEDNMKKISYLRKGSAVFKLKNNREVPIFHYPQVIEVRKLQNRFVVMKIQPLFILKRDRFVFDHDLIKQIE